MAAASAALPPIAIATADAVRSVPTDPCTRPARSAPAGCGRCRHVVLPATLPEILTGVRLAVGVAYTTVVAAETINGVPGIGGMIRDAQRYNQTDVVVLGIIVIGISGVLLDYCGPPDRPPRPLARPRLSAPRRASTRIHPSRGRTHVPQPRTPRPEPVGDD